MLYIILQGESPERKINYSNNTFSKLLNWHNNWNGLQGLRTPSNPIKIN